MFNFLKNLISNDHDKQNIETGIPPYPYSQSTLFVGTPESICEQYLSMETKTKSFIDLANTTDSFNNFANAQMRQAAYSSVAIHGFIFYIALNDLGINHIKPEQVNNLIYSDFLVDIYDFSWVMLQHCLNNTSFGQNADYKRQVVDFLSSDIASEGYPVLLMSYLVSENNALFGDECLKHQIMMKEMYGQNLDEYPSKNTLKSFDEMLKANMIGNPEEIQAFDAKFHVETFSDIGKVIEVGNKLRETILYNSLSDRIVRNFI